MEQNSNLSSNPDVISMVEVGNPASEFSGVTGSGGNNGGSGKPKKKKRIWLRILIVVLILVLILGIAGGIIVYKAYNWVGEKLDLMNHVKLDKKELCIDPQVEKDLKKYRNILIMGIDKRKGEDIEICRSDAMIVLSINKKSGKVKMVSVVRDSFLQIEEDGELVIDKLTHAHAYGGPINTIRAINRNLDLNIKEFIRIDWQTVADTVDNLGGLTLNIHKGEIKEMNKYIKDTNESLDGSKKKIRKPGRQKLNGVQVVTYCRIRKNDGDEERASRYRTAMVAAMKKARKAGLKKIDKTAKVVLPQITTNISSSSMRKLLIDHYDIKISDSKGWPYTWDGAQIEGVWYDVPITLNTNDVDLHKDIFRQKKYKPSQTVKEINDLIVYQSGYDEGQPVQYTNPQKKKK